MEFEMTAADSEREAREIGQLIRNYEKLTKLETTQQPDNAVKRRPNPGKAAKEDDAERWRQELTKRIERVRQQWATHGGSGEP